MKKILLTLGVGAFLTAANAQVPLDTDLNLYLPFCDGQVEDFSPINHDYTQATNDPAPDRNGVTNAARTMNSNPLPLPNNLIVGGDFTISVWYNYTGTTQQYPRLLDLSTTVNSTSDAIILYASNVGNNLPSFGAWNSNSQQMISLQASTPLINQWAHMVVTKVGTTYSMYLNGQPEISTTSAFVPANVARNISSLGRSAYVNTPELFPGFVDEVRVWQRGLSQIEVQTLYTQTDVCAPCDVNIPDAALKQALVNNTNINTNTDSEIQCSEAAAFTGYIGLNNPSITDLTGLEAFTSTTSLDISGTGVTSFDITANVSLTHFTCAALALTGTLTFDAANVALEELIVNANQLSGLDVTALPNLENLNFANNNLTSLDLSNNPALRILSADYNSLAALDLSNNLQLTDLYCGSNAIVALDVAGNPDLVSIDVSGNVPMTYLNVANGNNTNFTYYSSFNNPDLGCIQVDNVAYSSTNWTFIHPFSSFNTYCTPPITVGVDEAESKEFQLFPNPTTGTLHFSEAIAGQLLDVTGKILIQFPNTRTLDLSTLAEGVYLIRSNSGTVNRIVKN